MFKQSGSWLITEVQYLVYSVHMTESKAAVVQKTDRIGYVFITEKDVDRQLTTAVQSQGGLNYENNKRDYPIDDVYDKTYNNSWSSPRGTTNLVTGQCMTLNSVDK